VEFCLEPVAIATVSSHAEV